MVRNRPTSRRRPLVAAPSRCVARPGARTACHRRRAPPTAPPLPPPGAARTACSCRERSAGRRARSPRRWRRPRRARCGPVDEERGTLALGEERGRGEEESARVDQEGRPATVTAGECQHPLARAPEARAVGSHGDRRGVRAVGASRRPASNRPPSRGDHDGRAERPGAATAEGGVGQCGGEDQRGDSRRAPPPPRRRRAGGAPRGDGRAGALDRLAARLLGSRRGCVARR